MHQPVTKMDMRHAAELVRPLAKHVTDHSKLDSTFLIEVAQDFPCLFTHRYRQSFGENISSR